MPTKEEMQELEDHCEWEWTEVNVVNGSKVIGPNGSYIFLPAAGYRYSTLLNYDGDNGRYWSSTPYDNDTNACDVYFGIGGAHVYVGNRFDGQTVRPITE